MDALLLYPPSVAGIGELRNCYLTRQMACSLKSLRIEVVCYGGSGVRRPASSWADVAQFEHQPCPNQCQPSRDGAPRFTGTLANLRLFLVDIENGHKGSPIKVTRTSCLQKQSQPTLMQAGCVCVKVVTWLRSFGRCPLSGLLEIGLVLVSSTVRISPPADPGSKRLPDSEATCAITMHNDSRMMRVTRSLTGIRLRLVISLCSFSHQLWCRL
ncbi:unnamed protein product [Protopolystoma xenopodis]|uniref:Uncharacterized protein n=1 Tax=Protopolystoma xenopodis TaxID=117903 RepID=A0A448WZJ7_9PLAT|nr:unnamed protein product [Protopolystoma xenopodis]